MKENFINIEMENISPYVRFAQYCELSGDLLYVPQRIIYDYEMYFVINGEIQVECEQNVILLHKGDVHFMYPHIKHKRYGIKGTFVKYYSIHFDLNYNKSNDFSIENTYLMPCLEYRESVPIDEKLYQNRIDVLSEINLPSRLTLSNQSQAIDILEKIVSTFDSKPNGYTLICKSYMIQLLSLIFLQMQTQKKEALNFDRSYKNSIITPITHHLATNYTDDINITQLAIKYAISSSYLRKLFFDVNGISIKNYILTKRIEKAKELLIKSDYKINYIARLLGFKDNNYFSRIFKERAGKSPIVYRNGIK